MSEETPRQPTLVFTLDAETFGVRLEAVREIAEVGSIQPVPRAPGVIRGLTDVRGRMTTILDLPALFTGPSVGGGGRVMILAEPRDHLALWIGAEIDLVDLDLANLRPPETGPTSELLDGHASTGGTPVSLLSTEKILLACEREVLKRYLRAAP